MRSKMRSAFTRWPPKYEAMEEARRKYKGTNPRQKYEFQCSECHHWFVQTQVEVDHITPCGSLKSFEDLPGFVERMFCGKEGLRVVCKACHRAITKEARGKKDESTI